MSAAKKVTIKPPDQVYETDKAKKIYRSVCEIIKRLDSAQNTKTGFREAFTPDLILLRDRLQEYCEKLMFSWPLEYGRKAEEVIWRKGFYDAIQLVKRNIKEVKMDGAIEKAFKTHLASAIGYYTRLLLKIQLKFDISFNDSIDLGLIFTLGEDRSNQCSKLETKPIKTWATQACFRSLVYMGDIARYQHEYEGATKMMAQRYYHQALRLCPTVGMPYNQLGTLSGMNAYGFHAAYFYIRCLMSATPFEGTHNNLLKLFERNKKKLLELEAADDVGHNRLPHNFHHRHPRKNALSYVRSKNNKRFLLRFIRLIELFFASPKECDKTQVHELCQVVLDDFDGCLKSRCSASLKHDRGLSNDDKQNAVDDDVIFKVFVICLSSIYHLSKKGHDLIAAAFAFSLGMFSHTLNFMLTRLQPSLCSIDEFDQDESCSKKPRNPRKYTVQRMADKNERKVAESGLSPGGDGGGGEDDDGGGGDCGKSVKEDDNKCRDKEPTEMTLPNETYESLTREKKIEKKKRKVAFTSRKRTKGSDDDDDGDDNEDDDHDDDESDGDDNDEDNLSSEVESEGALSDFDLLSSSDEGSGMESQPEDGGREPEGHATRAPGYHKKVVSPAEHKVERNVKQNVKQSVKDDNKREKFEEIKIEAKENSKNSVVSEGVCKGDEPVVEKEDACKDGDNAKCDFSKPTSDNWKNVANLDESSETWMSDAVLFLGRALKTSCFKEDGTCNSSDILTGNRNIPVPPGFEKSLELQHVMEITEKLANFNIETDTDVNQSDGDDAAGDRNSDDEANVKMEKKRQEGHRREVSRILNIIMSERILEPAKIFIEWMTVNPLLVDSCAKISSSIWYRMASLLNLIPTERDVLESDLCTKNKNFANILCRELKNETLSTCRVFPLTEDIHLMEFPPLRVAHQRIDFDTEEYISEKQEAIVRLCRIRMFCRSLSTLQGIDFNYNQDSDTFQGPIVNPKLMPNKPKVNSFEGTSKVTLMRNLAQLRVKSQTGKERSVRELAAHGFPMYLVPDTESIYEGLKIMKKLVQHDKLRIVVPKVVLAYLDSIKTTSSMTMKALEWVEEEVYKNDQGHIRIQKLHEIITSTTEAKHGSKDDYILAIVDCCLHLLTRASSKEFPPDPAELNSVCLLTWMTVDNPELSEEAKNALEEAIRRGVKVKSVTEFFHQWQQLIVAAAN